MTTSEKWYKFAASNETPYFGWGSEAEADRYCDYLNRDRDINCYEVTEVLDADEQERLDESTEACNLSDELLEVGETGAVEQPDSADEAGADDGCETSGYNVRVQRHFYAGTIGADARRTRLVDDANGVTMRFATRDEAQQWIDEADRRTYRLAHGECARPDYLAVPAAAARAETE